MSNKNKKNKVAIDYTSRDFESIKRDLLGYTKRYYPDTFKDFNEASFGSLLLDTVAYVGDVLSFYVDYSVNESFINSSLEYDNVVKHANELGYKFKNSSISHGTCAFYMLVPAVENSSVPDLRYLGKLIKGTKVSTSGGVVFTLNEDVDFSNPKNEITAVKLENDDVSFFGVKSYGTVISGELAELTEVVVPYEKFLRVELPGEDITEVVSVTDSDGNTYYEVDYLSQNVVYREIPNMGEHSDTVPSILKPYAVARRFVVEQERDITYLQFGYGSEEEDITNSFTEPSNLILNVHGKNYISNPTLDPAKLTQTDKFGVAPSNTNLYIVYRVNSKDNVNASVRAINKVVDPRVLFKDRSVLDSQKVAKIIKSIEVENEEPITGDITLPSTEEIKRRAIDTFATQNRAVTAQDYKSMVYAMPSKYGSIKRCAIYRDGNDLKKNLNIYLVSETAGGFLENTNSVMIQNVKTWLNRVRMIGDSIDILPVKIFNIGLKFKVMAEDSANKYELLNAFVRSVADELSKINPVLAECFYITGVFKILKDVKGVLDVADVQVLSKTGGLYSRSYLDVSDRTSGDKRYVSVPYDGIWEIKYPFNDIVGVVV